MFIPYIVFLVVLVVSTEYRRSFTLKLDPNCRVKYHSILSSFTLKNFLIESMRMVLSTFVFIPITFFSKSLKFIFRGPSRVRGKRLCLRLRCFESCDAVVKFVSRSSSSADVLFISFESAEGSFGASLSEVFTLKFWSDFGAMSLTKSPTSTSFC